MEWTDRAILLGVSKYAERAAVVTFFSREYGMHRSISKAAYSKTQRGIYQPGNIVQLTWKARLQEHMGSVSAELQHPVAPLLMDDPQALDALSSLCHILGRTIHEREPHPVLYDKVEALFMHMAAGHVWAPYYVKCELALLAELGYGLDLRCCAATGETANLRYVSPKSARAVSEAAAAPYRDRLLPLPQFLTADSALGAVADEELKKGLQLTGYFLRHWVMDPHKLPWPDTRERMVARVEKRCLQALSAA